MSTSAQEEYFYKATHDIKSLIASINAYSYLVKKSLSQGAIQKAMLHTESIDKQAQVLTQTLDIFFDSVKIKEQTITFYKNPTDLFLLLQELQQEPSYSFTLKGKSNNLVSLDPSCFKRSIRYILFSLEQLGIKISNCIITLHQEENKTTITIDIKEPIPPEKIKALSKTLELSSISPAYPALYVAHYLIHGQGGSMRIKRAPVNFFVIALRHK